MPPTPKPPGQRRRRNANQAQWRRLPAEGRKGDPPPLPRKSPAWLKATREWWERIWASPMATAWIEADLGALYRLARLVDQAARKPGQPALHAQITALEDRLGLTPKARRQLQWEISKAEEEQEQEEQRPARRRHLRAVG